MKKKDLVRMLKEHGFSLVKGKKHDAFRKGGMTVRVPRHSEIAEGTANQILKDAGIK